MICQKTVDFTIIKSTRYEKDFQFQKIFSFEMLKYKSDNPKSFYSKKKPSYLQKQYNVFNIHNMDVRFNRIISQPVILLQFDKPFVMMNEHVSTKHFYQEVLFIIMPLIPAYNIYFEHYNNLKCTLIMSFIMYVHL